MDEMLKIILDNLIMIGMFFIPLTLMRIADIVLGVAIAKKNSISWDWNKFLWGIFYTICFIVGVGLFTTSISMIEPIVRIFGLIVDEATLTALNGISIIAVCLFVLTITITSYGKDCCEKIKILISKDTNAVSDTSKRGNI